ncbi:MAG: hypothetical protein KA998_00145 [Rickettsiaceae bacterium]|nr:hypothetical protein [Rickettsiaceae bacterium]
MNRRVFSTCLNKERKIYNCSVWAFICGGLALLFAGLAKGLLWGMGLGVGGFLLGSFLSKQWHQGNIQRLIYAHIPFAKYIVDKNMPESHHRRTM